jgi:hypothetical protein
MAIPLPLSVQGPGIFSTAKAFSAPIRTNSGAISPTSNSSASRMSVEDLHLHLLFGAPILEKRVGLEGYNHTIVYLRLFQN